MAKLGEGPVEILYICQHFSTPSRSTTGTRAYEFAKRFVRRGHRVTILSGVYSIQKPSRTSEPFIRSEDVDGIRVLWVNIVSSTYLGFVHRIFNSLLFALVAIWYVLTSPYRVLMVTSPPLTVGIPLLAASWIRRKRTVLEVRDLWPDFAVAMGIVREGLFVRCARWFERIVYRAASQIIALAPGIQERIANLGYPKERIALIPNGCDLDLFAKQGMPESPEDAGTFTLVYAGAHGQANGLDAVIDLAAELQRREETSIQIVLVGDGSQKNRLVQRTQEGGLKNVQFHAPLVKQEVAKLFQHCDAGLQILLDVPAFQQATSPNKFFDYLSAGLPVLINYPGWIADEIKQNQCGMEVPPDDPSAFADAVIWMKNHPEETRAMGDCARSLAESVYDREKLTQEFLMTIEDVAHHADHRVR